MYQLDPELAQILSAPSTTPAPAPPAAGDARGLHDFINSDYDARGKRRPSFPEGYPLVSLKTVAIEQDGVPVGLRLYTRQESSTRAGVVYIHGGGQVGGTAVEYDAIVADYVMATGIAFLSVDYRLAPDAQGLSQPEEGLSALRWLHDQAESLNVDVDRIAVMGDSAGGGIAAGTTMLAHEAGIPVVKLLLIYPQLDDRTTTAPTEIAPFLAWRPEDNVTGWTARLGSRVGGPDVSPVEAPARATDPGIFPPTYIEVGELDLFRNEDVAFASALINAQVPTELHVRPGLVHGFDFFAPSITQTRQAFQQRVEALMAILR